MKPDAFQSDRAGRVIKVATGYWAFVPQPLPPTLDYTPALLRLLTEAQHSLGELAGAGRFLDNPYLLVGPAMHREAVLSSRIEGTQSDLEDLFVFEADPDQPPERPDVREVSNYVLALEHGLRRLSDLPVSVRLIREMHARLMEGVRGQHALPGEFRTTQNWIGPPGRLLTEATFVPPPVEEMKEALGAWEKYLHSDDLTPPLVRLAFAHYQFEAIHPFVDGNGRIGRLLISLLLHHWELLPQPLLYLSAFFERHRGDYYRCLLRVSQQGDWEEWIEFFLLGVREQARDALHTAIALVELQKQYHALLHGRRLALITRQVLDGLFLNPAVTAPLLQKRCGVSFNTALKAIGDLEQAGILREISGRRSRRLWLAAEILDTIAGRRKPETAPVA